MSRQGMNRGVEPGTRIIPAVILGLSLAATISMVHAGAQDRGQPPSAASTPPPAPAARPAPPPAPPNVTPGVPMEPRAASGPRWSARSSRPRATVPKARPPSTRGCRWFAFQARPA